MGHIATTDDTVNSRTASDGDEDVYANNVGLCAFNPSAKLVQSVSRRPVHSSSHARPQHKKHSHENIFHACSQREKDEGRTCGCPGYIPIRNGLVDHTQQVPR